MEEALSAQFKSLWAKASNPQGESAWLPLYVHMSDSAEVAKYLWDTLVPSGTKAGIVAGILNSCDDSSEYVTVEYARKLFIFLAAVHDCGKATPSFQRKEVYGSDTGSLRGRIIDAGLTLPSYLDSPNKIPHALASFAILERCGCHRTLAIVPGSHHGVPPIKKALRTVQSWTEHTGFEDPEWVAVQDETVAFALKQAGLQDFRTLQISQTVQVLLIALVILSDWLASDADNFALIKDWEKAKSSCERAKGAWERTLLPPAWKASLCWKELLNNLYQKRFRIENPYPVQEAVVDLLRSVDEPGIMVIEAPMGEGKTEAALVAAEMCAEKSGRGGVYFALPTQATSDGIFHRVKNWVDSLCADSNQELPMFLAHGKARFNEEYRGIKLRASVGSDDDSDVGNGGHVTVNEWMQGPKKGILNSFVVGTIDQVLMAGLRKKHLMLRHLGLANKVVIIDECHAYDAYMNQYLFKVLYWLGAYRVPVIILTATLPKQSKKKVIHAYLGKLTKPAVEISPVFGAPVVEDADPNWALTNEYPLITYTNKSEVLQFAPKASHRTQIITIEDLAQEDIVSHVADLTDDGGCIGIILNTVSRAQELYICLQESFGEEAVRLLHSRFLSIDRAKRELELRSLLGPHGERPEKLIVVGTQVLEQSLDIDFDAMITDICPMDLLIQRMGRLHRHTRDKRPKKLQEPKCFVIKLDKPGQFEKGTEYVYGKYLLMNTQELLPKKIELPGDIAPLVQRAYADEGLEVAGEIREVYLQARKEHEEVIHNKENRASHFQIKPPLRDFLPLVSWLEGSVDSEKGGEATVRDSGDSLEVVIVQERSNGERYLLPWVGEGQHLARPLEERLAQMAAGCTVNLPPSLCAPYVIDKVIIELESDSWTQSIQDSYWLRGELIVAVDEEFKAFVGGTVLIYDKHLGLYVDSKPGKERER